MMNAQLGQKMGIPEENIFISGIGRILELTSEKAQFNQTVPSGAVFVDGFGVGDVGNIVIRDRKHLSQDGLIVVVVTLDSDGFKIAAGPDIISRGFVYVRESETLMNDTKEIARQAIENCFESGVFDWSSVKSAIKSDVSAFLQKETKRKPMVLPVIMEV